MTDSDIKSHANLRGITELAARKHLNIKTYCSCGKCGEVLELEFAQWSPPVDVQLIGPISAGWQINLGKRENSLCPKCAESNYKIGADT